MRISPAKYLAGLCLSLGLLTACQAETVPTVAASSPKISPQLAVAAQALSLGQTTQARTDAQGRLQVYVYVTGVPSDVLDKLSGAGLIAPRSSAEMGVVQGWIAPRDLERVAALACVKILTLPRYASPH